MLCTHFLMTEFTDMKCVHSEPPKLPHTTAYATHSTHAAVVELPTPERESSFLHRCTRHLRKLNLQTMFYNI